MGSFWEAGQGEVLDKLSKWCNIASIELFGRILA
jgi:hypothetical protein